MRVALVSPYSWTYPGGVTRHIEALAGQLLRSGHDVTVFAPFDRDDRATVRRHRGARPEAREAPPWLVPIGGTVGWPVNGAVSNLALTPSSASTLRRELRTRDFDVVHVHEPVAPTASWDVLGSTRLPLVGTFHCHSESVPVHFGAVVAGARRRFNRLRVRLAVSEAAAWTGRRFYGGRYRIVPNGVSLPAGGAPPAAGARPRRAAASRVRRAGGRAQGLPVLLRAFEALRRETAVTLTVVGSAPEELAPLLLDAEGVVALGRVSDAERHRALLEADVLCAPSLGGESFGMVLTEAFAAGRR
jgi:phosphatidylinositol alpha-mannosyltransferase